MDFLSARFSSFEGYFLVISNIFQQKAPERETIPESAGKTYKA